MAPLEAILIGAGQRGKDSSGGFARRFPEELKFIAVAEPDKEKRELFASQHGIPAEMCFSSYAEILERPQLAPLCFNTTMDQEHLKSSLEVLGKGYHLFLEKPMAHTPEGCLLIMEEARKLNLMVQICHPLRYTTFYTKIKELLDAGKIGKIISLSMFENVGYWHFAHSYVRGNWRNFETSGPPMLTKCCHDMDIATWLVDENVRNISSFGSLSFFKETNAPEGAPARCTDGCPVEGTCPFYAPKFYLKQANEWPVDVICVNATHEARSNALKTGPYGRCVFRSDNNVPDHQVVGVEFENDVTLDFAVRANSYDCYRTIRILGAEGELNGHMEKNSISIDRFQAGLGEAHAAEHHTPETVIGAHGGGDTGVIRNFLTAYKNEDYEGINRSLEIAVEGHLLSFASEEARRSKSIVSMQEYKKAVLK